MPDVGVDQTDDHLGDRRLAGPRLADDGERATGGDVERDVIDDERIAVPLRQANDTRRSSSTGGHRQACHEVPRPARNGRVRRRAVRSSAASPNIPVARVRSDPRRRNPTAPRTPIAAARDGLEPSGRAVDARTGGDETGGIRVQRVVVQQRRSALLDDLAGVHHRRAVADRARRVRGRG